jgi:nitroreductase
VDLDVFQAIRERRSIRVFLSRPVEPKKLQAILEATNNAPSAGNLQAYLIYNVTDPARRRALAQAAYNQEYIATAPVLLAFCTDPARSMVRYGQRGARLYAIQDATIAVAYAQLAVTALGLASVWVGAFDDGAAARALDLPIDIQPVALLPIGYPAETPKPLPRRPLAEMIRHV